jgi:hypothetical protein
LRRHPPHTPAQRKLGKPPRVFFHKTLGGGKKHFSDATDCLSWDYDLGRSVFSSRAQRRGW